MQHDGMLRQKGPKAVQEEHYKVRGGSGDENANDLLEVLCLVQQALFQDGGAKPTGMAEMGGGVRSGREERVKGQSR